MADWGRADLRPAGSIMEFGVSCKALPILQSERCGAFSARARGLDDDAVMLGQRRHSGSPFGRYPDPRLASPSSPALWPFRSARLSAGRPIASVSAMVLWLGAGLIDPACSALPVTQRAVRADRLQRRGGPRWFLAAKLRCAPNSDRPRVSNRTLAAPSFFSAVGRRNLATNSKYDANCVKRSQKGWPHVWRHTSKPLTLSNLNGVLTFFAVDSKHDISGDEGGGLCRLSDSISRRRLKPWN